MINLLKQSVKETWKSMNVNPWMYVLIVFSTLAIAIGLCFVLNKFLKQDIVGRKHFIRVSGILCKFVLAWCEVSLFVNLGWIGLSAECAFYTALILEVFPYLGYLIWGIVGFTTICVIANIKKKQLRKQARNALNGIKTTVPGNLKKTPEEICTIFTRMWIKSHIEIDGTRYATIANHKVDFITQLSAELNHVSDTPTDMALTHYNKCVKLWKK